MSLDEAVISVLSLFVKKGRNFCGLLQSANRHACATGNPSMSANHIVKAYRQYWTRALQVRGRCHERLKCHHSLHYQNKYEGSQTGAPGKDVLHHYSGVWVQLDIRLHKSQCITNLFESPEPSKKEDCRLIFFVLVSGLRWHHDIISLVMNALTGQEICLKESACTSQSHF